MWPSTLPSIFSAILVTSIGVLALPTSSAIRIGLYPIPGLLMIFALAFPPTDNTGPVEETYALSLMGSSLFLRLIDYLYIQGYDTPKHIYKIEASTAKDGTIIKARQEHPQSAWGRLKWTLLLLVSQRGIGWNIQGRTPETKYPSKRSIFVRQAVIDVLEIYLALYLFSTGCNFMIAVLRHESSVDVPVWATDLFRNQAFQMVVGVIGVVSMITQMSIIYNIAAIMCVGFGVGRSWKNMDIWPNILGSFSDAWSVRSFWGEAWHQTLRKAFTAPGERAASFLFGEPSKLSRNMRLLRRYFLLFSAFTTSGMMHAAGSYFVTVTNPQPYPDSTPIDTRPAWYATSYFFIVQALVITMEDFVYWIFGISTDAKEVKRNTFRWLLGMAWTYSWLTYSTTAIWYHLQLTSFGYRRVSDIDAGNGYVHVLEAIATGCKSMPLNPWPYLLDNVAPIIKNHLK